DGIRDLTVTGVQTCALPISSTDLLTWTMDPGVRIGAGAEIAASGSHPVAIGNPDGSVTLYYSREGVFPQSAFFLWAATSPDGLRSEERRVGKGCRSRGSACR